jgi:hypothetical protein
VPCLIGPKIVTANGVYPPSTETEFFLNVNVAVRDRDHDPHLGVVGLQPRLIQGRLVAKALIRAHWLLHLLQLNYHRCGHALKAAKKGTLTTIRDPPGLTLLRERIALA